MSSDARLRVALTVEQCWHDVPGGTAVAVIGIAAALGRRADVEVLGVSARHRNPPPQPWDPPLEVHSLPLPRLALYESWHRIRRPSVQLATGPVDVVHATSSATPPRSAPLVVTIHDLAWRADPSHFTRRGVSFFERGLSLALSDADLVTCPSKATAEACRAVGFEAERVRLVPLGVDTTPATDDAIRHAKARYGLSRDYILWTGTIEPRKNLRTLLQAFAMLDGDCDLVLAGPRGWGDGLDVDARDRDDGVRMLGFVPREDLAPLYAGARVFCFPSLLEGFGFPVLEAMAQSTPVVTSAGTSTEELVTEGAGLAVDPRSPSAIADALRRVLDSDELAHELGRAGRERASAYTWDGTAAHLAEVYREAARCTR